jgi:hypothetical protein
VVTPKGSSIGFAPVSKFDVPLYVRDFVGNLKETSERDPFASWRGASFATGDNISAVLDGV